MNKKFLAMALALVLLIGGVVSGSLAWLTDKTDAVENTFTQSNINIELEESENLDLQMIPGHTITKDPKVTVVDGSEDCWLFVKVEESENFDSFMTYEMADGWNALTGVSGVYYREVTGITADQTFAVLAGNQVKVLDTVNKSQMDAIANGTATVPTLTFTAYAVQYYKTNGGAFTAVEAWAEANP